MLWLVLQEAAQSPSTLLPLQCCPPSADLWKLIYRLLDELINSNAGSTSARPGRGRPAAATTSTAAATTVQPIDAQLATEADTITAQDAASVDASLADLQDAAADPADSTAAIDDGTPGPSAASSGSGRTRGKHGSASKSRGRGRDGNWTYWRRQRLVRRGTASSPTKVGSSSSSTPAPAAASNKAARPKAPAPAAKHQQAPGPAGGHSGRGRRLLGGGAQV